MGIIRLFHRKEKYFFIAQAALWLGFRGSLETLLATVSKLLPVWKSQSITDSGLSKFLPPNFPANFLSFSRPVGSYFQPEIPFLVFIRGAPRIAWQGVEVALSISFDPGLEVFRYLWKISISFPGWARKTLLGILRVPFNARLVCWG